MTLSKSIPVLNGAPTPLDGRFADMAKIVANRDGSPRTGILTFFDDYLSPIDLLTPKATMHVTVAPAEFVTSRGKSDGVHILTNDGNVDVAISAAPVSNSRITVVWVKQNDSTQGDANSLPVFGTTDGTAAASPTKPAIPTGALELGTIRVYSGTTAANGGSNVTTDTYQLTAMRGGVVRFRSTALLAAWTNAIPGQLAAVVRDDTSFLGLFMRTNIASTDTWVSISGGPVAIGKDKGTTLLTTGGWAALNTAAGTGTNHRNDGFTYGTGNVDVPVPGFYRVSVTLSFPSAAGGTIRGVKITGDGTMEYTEMTRATAPAGTTYKSVSGVLPITSALVVQGYQDSGGSITVAIDAISIEFLTGL